MNIVIIGGSGGIGLAMVQEALNRFSRPTCMRVTMLPRRRGNTRG
jgi:NAD(P)-dependent dehydrogenase (short-subunit alcohol dehydrogenase family)